MIENIYNQDQEEWMTLSLFKIGLQYRLTRQRMNYKMIIIKKQNKSNKI